MRLSHFSSARRLLTALLLSFTLAGCNSDVADVAEEKPPTLETGTWHGELTLPGGASFFGMEVSRETDKFTVTLINGTERLRVPDVTVDGDRLTMLFPAFNNRVDARLTEDGLSGSLTLVKRYGKTQIIPFAARPGTRPPHQPASAAAKDLSGRWQVTFTESDGTTYPAIGEFSQRGNRLLGTFLTQTGDYRFLGGSIHGRDMRLSTFDGAHAFLFTASLDDSNQLVGQFWSGTEWMEDWVGVRNESASLADAAALTFLKPGYDTFEFSFPDLDGNPVSLDDTQFDGKVVLVTLAGSWCPNCHDEAAFMTELYEKYAGKGVEVIALMYEHLEDQQLARRQVQLFRDKFDIKYTTLLAGISDKTAAASTLPALNHVLAFPTTLFIDRDGEVREIHTGFSGPGTGEHYEKLKRRIYTLVDELVAEQVSPAETPSDALSPESPADDGDADGDGDGD